MTDGPRDVLFHELACALRLMALHRFQQLIVPADVLPDRIDADTRCRSKELNLRGKISQKIGDVRIATPPGKAVPAASKPARTRMNFA